jgi:perosamine synthetase
MNAIPYSLPSITEREIAYVNDAIRNGWGPKCYEYINKFEDAFQSFVGAKYAISTSSCTGAMQMGLAAMGITQGDEVILADTNWIATVSPIVQLGAKPVFVDIDPKNWCISKDAIEPKINQNTKAIVVTHLYGNVAGLKELKDLSERYSIPLIEDAAEAVGAKFLNQQVGSFGLFSTFSFHGTKTLTTGEGGMFATSNKGLFEIVLQLSNHGRAANDYAEFRPSKIGYKFKMSNMQAALGLAQLERVQELVQRKQEILDFYRENLKHEHLQLNPENNSENENGAWMTNVVFSKESKISTQTIREVFKNNQIDARVFFPPLSSLPMFEKSEGNTLAYDISARSINLPSFHDITNDQQYRICEILLEILK